MIHGWKKDNEATYYQQSSKKAKQINKEKEAADDIRTKSLERLSKTRKKETQGSASSCSSYEKRPRSSGGDTIAYLQEKSEKDIRLQEAELKLRREELELNKSRETLLC